MVCDQEIHQRLRDASHPRTFYEMVKEGGVAYYIQLNPLVGLKLYFKRERAKLCYDLQSYAHAYGLAPFVSRKVELYWEYLEAEVFGFITEHIPQTYAERYAALPDADIFKYLKCDKDYLLLKAAYRRIGMTTIDFHHHNVGFTSDLRLLPFDFSHERMIR